jgi:pyruvate dehydrogenase E2 component (dihydrolipoamide acetyltransferase)
MTEFRMPSLGADMEEGILLEWLVKVGDPVRRGDIVAVVETPKSAVDVESFDDGTVQELLVEEGTTVPVGEVLAIIAEPAAAPRSSTVPAPAEQASMPAPQTETPAAPPPNGAPSRRPSRLSPVLRHRAHQLGIDPDSLAGSGPDGAVTRADIELAANARPARRQRVSPLARRLAAEHGVDLGSLAGTGAGGGIRAADVEAAVAARTPSTTSTTVPPPSEDSTPTQPATSAAGRPSSGSIADMRGAIAALMSRSNREIPHYYLSATIDLHEALAWMRERNRELDVSDRLVPAALLLVAAARAARQVTELNGHWLDDGFRPADEVRLGLILSLRGGGLLVPAIQEADRLSVVQMMDRIRDLTRRARAGRLRGSELVMPTISVSNLGEQGVESVHGVIYPPQVALVGFGTVSDRPWAVDGLLGVRPLVTATLAADHRATDAATGARFLRHIDKQLQTPEEL